MFAVVQIGSKARRSPCMTARMVLPAAGCARSTLGAWVSAAVAAVACRNVRRVVFMRPLPDRAKAGASRGPRSIYSRDAPPLQGARRAGASNHQPPFGQLVVGPVRARDFRVGVFAQIHRRRT